MREHDINIDGRCRPSCPACKVLAPQDSDYCAEDLGDPPECVRTDRCQCHMDEWVTDTRNTST